MTTIAPANPETLGAFVDRLPSLSDEELSEAITAHRTAPHLGGFSSARADAAQRESERRKRHRRD